MGVESFMMLMLMGIGGGGDVLDFTDSKAYWQANAINVVDTATMTGVLNNKKSTPAQRLMAVRSLGEIGSAKGADDATKAGVLKVLTPLVDSKQPFVGRYAKRSIAWVKGQDPEPPAKVSQKMLDADLALLPKSSQIVGQMRMVTGPGPVDWSAMLPKDAGPEIKQQMQMMPKMIGSSMIELSQMIGNVRVDAVTVGVTFFGTGDDGYATIVARGQYDRIGLQIAMEKMNEDADEDEKLSLYSIGDIEVISNKNGNPIFVVLMPSDDRLVLMFGEPGQQGAKAFAVDATAKRIQAGDTKPQLSEAVTGQLKQIDRSKADLWVAMEVPKVLKDEGPSAFFGPFQTMHAFAKRDSKGMMNVTWKGKGDNAQKVGQAVAYLNKQAKEGAASMKEMSGRAPQMKVMFDPIIQMLESLDAKSQGTAMTGTIKLPANLGMMMPMMFMGFAGDAGGGF